MKAIVTTGYGPPDVLKLMEIERPVPKENEVLIKVCAATVTAGDCELRRFDIPLPVIFWLPLRIILGIFKPRKGLVQGQEMAGEVVETGKYVKIIKVGDRVFGGTGFSFGAYGEFRRHKAGYPTGFIPENVSYEDAVTLPVGGINALHFLRKANIQPGQKVLIYGSTGSIGTYAVQVAKYYGAEVTAVCRSETFELMKSIGADHVMDYREENYWEKGMEYDVIFEAVGKSPFIKGLRCVREKGIYILSNPKFFQLFRGGWISRFGNKRVISQFASEKKDDLNFLARLLEEKKIKAVIDCRFKLEEMEDAHRYVEQGTKVGHVVISITS